MSQESRGNVLCFDHKGPLSECTDGCEIKKGAKQKMDQVNVQASRANVLRLPIIDAEAVDKARVMQQADLARLAEVRERARIRQEELLAEAEKEASKSDTEKPETE